jgi:peptidoglycan/LPS O-acetylase OafA/YrhL
MASSGTYSLLHFLSGNGHLGVNFFFVLSGFLITALLMEEEKTLGRINLIQFYLRRILRIWPLYYATFTFGYFVFPWLASLAGGQFQESANPWFYIFFLGNFNSLYTGEPLSGTLAVLWSIAIEEQFYLVWPILLMVFKHYRLFLFLLVIVASLVFRAVNIHNPDILFYHTCSVMSDLAAGGMLGWWSSKNSWKIESFSCLSRMHICSIYLLGITLIIARDHIFVHPWLITIERMIFALFFAFIIFEQTYIQPSLFKAGRHRTMNMLGKYTYGLYCLHIPAMVFAVGIGMVLQLQENYWWTLAGLPIVTLILSITLSLLSYYGIEKPFLRIKRTFSPVPQKQLSHQ